MIEVVRIKDATISVREDKVNGLSICFRCAGFKTVGRVHYLGLSSMLAIVHNEWCEVCGGQGLFFTPPPKAVDAD